MRLLQGQEVTARLRGGDLDFGRGWKLSPPSPRSEYTIETPVLSELLPPDRGWPS